MADKEQLRKLLSDAIPDLCRNSLPPSVTFRVEAMIGITVIDDVGRDAVGEGNVTVLSFQQTVSDDGVSMSQFGSNGPPHDVAIASHKPTLNLATILSHPPQSKEAGVSVKEEEYSVDTGEYDAVRRPVNDTCEDCGSGDGGELVADEGEDVSVHGNEEDYDDDGQYYDDDSSGYTPGVKFVATDTAADGSESGTGGCISKDKTALQLSAAGPLKSKLAKRRASVFGSWLGADGVMSKSAGTACGGMARGGTVGRTSHDRATAVVVRQQPS